MHKIILSTAVLLIFLHTTYAQENIGQPELKSFIDSLYQVDQQVQKDLIAAFQNGLPIDSIGQYESIKNETFKRHITMLKDIIKNYGFLSPQLIGKKSAANFFVLIQHADADIDFQSAMLPFIKEQVDTKMLNGWEYAYLYDRIMVNTGKEQLYGHSWIMTAIIMQYPKNWRIKKR